MPAPQNGQEVATWIIEEPLYETELLFRVEHHYEPITEIANQWFINNRPRIKQLMHISYNHDPHNPSVFIVFEVNENEPAGEPSNSDVINTINKLKEQEKITPICADMLND